ncbi:GNAT family N-acetyltransferase [Thalassotalea sp. M1531]|uniref:GNAT family N-acetyltransferase n=1 Tax=Thalassotalea algicola TaxID=2716224 RepID=A0A7Y0LA74_9GAMM|nr:GNAT family N-acetyltransferase [Thalassotalea algicola]NMP30701.1 GNAT family N-acetyltransferase [Thalassotalea algicola]
MKIYIRPTYASDVEDVIPLMFSAGPEAYRYVFSQQSSNQALEFLREAYLRGGGEFGFSSHFVACQGDRVIGLLGLRQPNNNWPYAWSALTNILRYYSLVDALKVLVRGLKFEQIVKPTVRNRLCIHNLAVSESCQGLGVGRQLIEYAVNQAQALGFSHVCLDVAETNPKAKALYQRLGFITQSHHVGNLNSTYGKGVSHDYMELILK